MKPAVKVAVVKSISRPSSPVAQAPAGSPGLGRKKAFLDRKKSVSQFAAEVTKDELQRIKELFAAADRSKRGSLSRLELHQVFEDLGVHPTVKGFEALFLALDADRNGFITLEEFVGGFSMLKRGSGGVLGSSWGHYDGHDLFKMCDVNGDGFISRAELKQVLSGQKVSQHDFEVLWSALDSNKDDRISLAEFLQAMAWMRAVHLNDVPTTGGDSLDEDKLKALKIYTHNVLKAVVETSQRAADKNMVKTAHACIDIIEEDALVQIEQLVGKLVSDGERARITRIKSLSAEAANNK